jgi:hypothetical protein
MAGSSEARTMRTMPTMRTMRTRRSRPRRIAAVVLGVVLALLLAELLLRVQGHYGLDRVARHFEWFGAPTRGAFTVDPEIGFRPILGTGKEYSPWGTRPNGYAFDKPAGVERLLFVGDSVTARGRIVRAVQAACGGQREFWNAGVESFNTRQQVEFYRRYNAPLAADHVILTFHVNDFDVTPVAFLDEQGDLVVYGPKHPFPMSRWMYENLYLARFWVARTASTGAAREEEARQVRAALLDLRGMLREGQRFTVVVFALVAPRADWDEQELWAYEGIVALLQELEIRYFDLWPVVERALADGVTVEETPGDRWHPSEEVARRMGEYLCEAGLLR